MSNEQFYHFEDDRSIPNNPRLPLIVYPGAFKENPKSIEGAFNKNGWTNSWVDGVFD